MGSKLVGERNSKLHFSFMKTSPSKEHLNRSESESRSVRLFATPWPVQSMEFSRPEYWSWVAFPFSRGSSQPRDQTQVSHIAGGWILYQLSHQGSDVKESAVRETRVWSLGREDPLEKEMANHSSVLAWKIPWTGAWQATVHGVTTGSYSFEWKCSLTNWTLDSGTQFFSCWVGHNGF